MSEILRAMTIDGLQPGEIIPVTYQDGEIEEGQPAGAGWTVTRVYEHYDVYHQVDPGLDELEEAMSAAMRHVAGISDEVSETEKELFAEMMAGKNNIEWLRPFRLKLTETGIQKFKPRHGEWAMTLLYDYFEVYHQPGVSRETLEQALAEAVKRDPEPRRPIRPVRRQATMELDPHMLDTNWPMTYVAGKVRVGQPEGAGWNVTRDVVGFMDVYHQGEVAPEVLVEAIHREIRAWTGSVTSERPLDLGLPNRLNYTFPGQGLKVGGRPDDPAFVVTEVMPTFAVWHYPDVPLETLIVVLRLNIQGPFWAQAFAGE